MDKELKPPFLRSGFNYDTNKASEETGLACKDKSLTQQHFKDECDINTIVERFHLTGELPENVRMPTYGDFTGITDFKEAMNAIRTAQESFNAMPWQTRERFQNDPQRFLEFCGDPANQDEAIKLGLAVKRPQEPATTASGTPEGQGDSAVPPKPKGAARASKKGSEEPQD